MARPRRQTWWRPQSPLARVPSGRFIPGAPVAAIQLTPDRGRMPPTPLWRDRNFLIPWAGQTVSAYGDQVTVVALPRLAIGTLGATPWQMGLLGAARRLPFMPDRPLRRRFGSITSDAARYSSAQKSGAESSTPRCHSRRQAACLACPSSTPSPSCSAPYRSYSTSPTGPSSLRSSGATSWSRRTAKSG